MEPAAYRIERDIINIPFRLDCQYRHTNRTNE